MNLGFGSGCMIPTPKCAPFALNGGMSTHLPLHDFATPLAKSGVSLHELLRRVIDLESGVSSGKKTSLCAITH